MNLFLVTSAINTNYTIDSIENRLLQTIETANSIRKYCPDVKIVLLEGGKPLNEDMKDLLYEAYDAIFDFSSHDIIKYGQSPEHLKVDTIGHTVKTPCESYMLKEAMKMITGDFDRILKMSGRYQLNENFNIQTHLDAKDKYVFLPKAPAGTVGGIVDEVSGKMTKGKIPKDWSNYCYELVMFSFEGKMLRQTQKLWNTIFKRVIDIYSEGNYIDIETITYMVFGEDIVKEIPVVGVQGVLAMNKEGIVNK